jgi:hypothetical protein
MVHFDYFAAVSLVFSFVSIFLVIFQLHNHTEQRKIESLIQISDINRQLVTLAFSKPELFDVLHGGKNTDPIHERHFLQLWFNEFALIHALVCRGLFSTELREGLERDMRDFLAQENMQRHWRLCRNFYSLSFQKFVDALIAPDAKGGLST